MKACHLWVDHFTIRACQLGTHGMSFMQPWNVSYAIMECQLHNHGMSKGKNGIQLCNHGMNISYAIME